MSNSFDPDQARHFVRPNLGPNCLQRLSGDDQNPPSKERDNTGYVPVKRDSHLNQVNMQASRFIRVCNETVLLSPHSKCLG